MTFPTDDIYLGPASFGARKGTEGIIWHTTEAAGTSRAAAVGTAEWQKSNPGSYNFIIYDGGILLTVPYMEASGGVNPASLAWAPGRYPFLKAQLSAGAYADPNAYLLNVAFSGKTAVFRDSGLPPNMLATAKRLVLWAETTFGRRMVQCGHMHWQTNRSDPSQQVLDAIAEPSGGTTNVADIDTFILENIVIDAGAAIRSGPSPLASKYFTTSRVTPVVSVGTKNGFHAYWQATRWAYTDTSANVLSRAPYQQTVEVPTGITQEQLDNARADGKAIQEQGVTSLRNIGLRADADADALAAKTIR